MPTKANKIRHNVKNAHYAVATVADDGTCTWSTPVAMPGAKSIQMEPQGNQTKFYADGIVYFRGTKNNGLTVDFELALIPTSFYTDVYKRSKGETSGVITEKAGVEEVAVALLFEEEGDVAGTMYALYKGFPSRPKRTSSTDEEGYTIETDTITFEFDPLANGDVWAMTDADTPASVLASWYSAVFVETSSDDVDADNNSDA